MKRIPENLLLLLLTTLGGGMSAQQAITFAGADGMSSAASFSYSCGEVAVQKASVASITVFDATQYFTEGVQQGYPLRELGIDEILNVNISVYPNPTTGSVTMENNEAIEGLNYELYDLDGRLIQHGDCSNTTTSLDLSQCSSGSYMLRITNADKKRNRIYKIIKK